MTFPSNFDEMKESKYLAKEDVKAPKLMTIRGYERENVARKDDKPEFKWIIYFNEHEKGMVLGTTNRELLKIALQTSNPAETLGRQIVLFNDPTVSYGGKLTGGIRLRAPRIPPPAPIQQTIQPQQYKASSAPEAFNDDIPF